MMDIVACNERLELIKKGSLQNNQYTECPNINIELKQHQKEMLYSMENLEHRKLKFDKNTELETGFGVCGNCTGSGKSYIIIALIINNPLLESQTKIVKQFGNMLHLRSKYSYTRKSNLIIAPHQCVNQWDAYMTNVSELKHFVIARRSHVQKHKLLKDDPDVIIISSTMYNAFFSEQENSSSNWSRVIYDEADSINISNVYQASSNFVWFVSSSLQNLLFPSGQYFTFFNKNCVSRKFIEGIKHTGFIREIFRNLEKSSANPLLPHIILKHNDDSIKHSFQLQQPIYQIIKCKSPIYVTLLHDIVSSDVLQALNAGDIHTAIEKLGCDVNTEENIIEIITRVFQIKLQNVESQIEYTQSLVVQRTVDQIQKEKKIETLKKEKDVIVEKINNVKTRIAQYKNEACPICIDTITKPTVTNCCNNVFCFECIVRSYKATKKCPMCRDCDKGFVVIGESHQHATLPTKLDALFELYNQNPEGKFLIFSAYEESFRNVSNMLIDKSISHCQLMGTIPRINKILNSYTEGKTSMLMLNSTHYGTGLNLQMTTDLIFYHKMNPDMEKQVIGRAQRPGRTDPLKIHYLYQENEFKAVL
jgi:SNF2 family DNA or RNA helicase